MKRMISYEELEILGSLIRLGVRESFSFYFSSLFCSFENLILYRKITEFSLKNRRNLKNIRSTWNISFREDLCEANLNILEKCEQMKKDSILAKVYTHNGFVKVAKTMKDRAVRLSHISELNNFLPSV